MYDPVLARFISPDPIIPDLCDPQMLNRYAYARNNPLKYTDPNGHTIKDPQNEVTLPDTVVVADRVVPGGDKAVADKITAQIHK